MNETDTALISGTQGALVAPPQPARLPASIEKAAIILTAVGPEMAARFLRDIPEPDRARFARAADGLADVAQDVLDAVITEFLDGLSLATQADGPQARARQNRLSAAPPEALAVMLQSEHPQTAAVILRELPQARGAQVLDALDRDFARSVVVRLTRLPDLEAQVIRRVMAAFERQFAPEEREATASPRSDDLIGGLMGGISTGARQAFLNELDAHEPALARALRRKLITFDEIALRMEGRDIDLVARDVPEPVLLAALKHGTARASASAGFILSNLPCETAVRYARELAAHARVTEADGEAAQLALVRAIEAQVRSGAIRLNEPG
jgi:flagellar motor switch protein FliG